MIVCQGFLHFSYGIRESHNLINITKITSSLFEVKKKSFGELKHKELLRERERERRGSR